MKIKRFEFNMFPVNCYLLYDNTGEAVIIDPGCYFPEEKEFIRDYIQSKGLTVKHMLCTHLHLDHVFGCQFIKDTFGVGIEANPADEFWLEQAPQQARTFGLHIQDMNLKIDKHILDGDIIKFGEKKLLFSGDILFQGSIGRADLQGGNFEELKENICNRLFVLPEDVTVYPGHGPSTTIEYEKKNNPFFI